MPLYLGSHSSFRAGGHVEGLSNFLHRLSISLSPASRFGTLLAYPGGQGRKLLSTPVGPRGTALLWSHPHKAGPCRRVFSQFCVLSMPAACFSKSPGTFYKDLLIAPVYPSPLMNAPQGSGLSLLGVPVAIFGLCARVYVGVAKWVGTALCGGLWRAVGRGH